jgi:hypothetical protein
MGGQCALQSRTPAHWCGSRRRVRARVALGCGQRGRDRPQRRDHHHPHPTAHAGDHTKRVLTDTEVVLLHERRQRLDRDAEKTLEAYVARDPWNPVQRLAHLFVVAEPRPGKESMLLAARDHGQDPERFIQDLIFDSAHVGGTGIWEPDFTDATRFSTRSDGWAMTNYSIVGGRKLEHANEKTLIEIEITEAGAVRVFCGRASDSLNNIPRCSSYSLPVSPSECRASRATSPNDVGTSASGPSD